MGSKLIFLSGVMSGKLNGQLVTVKTVINILKEKEQLFLIDRSLSKFHSFLNALIYGLRNNKMQKVYYIFIHRSRIGFYIRDLPVFIISILMRGDVVIHLVGQDVRMFLDSVTKLEKKIIIYFYLKARCYVFLGEVMMNEMLKILPFKGGLPKFVIAPGVYDQGFNETNSLQIEDKKYDVCYMSNFIEEKGIIDFIDSVIYLNEILGVKINAWIAGQQINENSVVKDKIKQAEGKRYFTIHSPIMGDEKWELLKNTKIFILPTYYKTESLPLSLVDAMIAGCVCISTDVGEIHSLLGNQRGVLVPARDPVFMAREIRRLLNSNDLMRVISSRSKYFARENFSFEKYQESISRAIV